MLNKVCKSFFKTANASLTIVAMLVSLVFPALTVVPQIAYADSVVLFEDGFESGDFSEWDSADSNWDVTGTDAHSGSKKTAVEGEGDEDGVLLRSQSTEGLENITLNYSYRVRKSLESGDHVYVEWSTDENFWITLADLTGLPASDDWVQSSHLILGLADQGGFQFRFRAVFDSKNDELLLDDVSLTGEGPEGRISGYKWNDLDGDGHWCNEEEYDAENCEEVEPGIEEWPMWINGSVIYTDENGYYEFAELYEGGYTVCEISSEGWSETYPPGFPEGFDVENAVGCGDEGLEPMGYDVEITDERTNYDELNFGNRQTSQEQGQIIVRKVTIPENTDQKFDFFLLDEFFDEYEDEFTLSGGEEEIFDVDEGTYTITETVPSGWDLTNIFCEYDDESVGESAPPNGETVTVEAGDMVTCTFTNTLTIGIITGYKFNDLNGDGEWYTYGNSQPNEPGIKDWTVALGRVGEPEEEGDLIPIEIIAMDLTGANGNFVIPVPEPGQYVLLEEQRVGWVPTTPSPVDSFFDIFTELDLDGEELPPFVTDSFFDVFVDLDGRVQYETNSVAVEEPWFGNFALVNITGFKWDDKNGDGVWQKENEENPGEPGLQDVSIALGRETGPAGQDGTIPIEIIAMNLTSIGGSFTISDVGPGRYKLFEENKSGWQATNPAPRIDSFFDITYDLASIAIGDPDFDLLRIGDPDFDLLRSSFFDVFVGLSGQNVNQSEAMHTIVTTIPSVPLEFGNHKLLVISEEAEAVVEQTSVTITWMTDFPGTSRVVYDTVSHPVLGSAPNYEYANSTAIFDESPKVTDHSVLVSGLTSGTTYFYRTISSASPESVGGEGSFSTGSSGGDGGSGGSSSSAGTGGGGSNNFAVGIRSNPSGGSTDGEVLGASAGSESEVLDAVIINNQIVILKARIEELKNKAIPLINALIIKLSAKLETLKADLALLIAGQSE